MVAALPNPRIPDLACHPGSGGLAWNPSCWLSFRLAAHVPKSLQHTCHDLLREIITAIAKSETLTPQIDQNREGYTVWVDDKALSRCSASTAKSCVLLEAVLPGYTSLTSNGRCKSCPNLTHFGLVTCSMAEQCPQSPANTRFQHLGASVVEPIRLTSSRDNWAYMSATSF